MGCNLMTPAFRCSFHHHIHVPDRERKWVGWNFSYKNKIHRLKIVWHSHTMAYSENKNKWTTTTHNMDEYHNIMLSKRSQTQKITCWSIPFMGNIKTGKLTYGIISQDSGYPLEVVNTGRRWDWVVDNILVSHSGTGQICLLCENSF